MVKNIVVLAISLVFVLPKHTNAEELLTINGGDYLGNKKSDSRFVTCLGADIIIGNGTVKPTDRKCSDGVIGPLIGTVMKLDAKNVTIRDSHGTEISIVPTSRETAQLSTLRVGTSVSISGRTEESRQIRVTPR